MPLGLPRDPNGPLLFHVRCSKGLPGRKVLKTNRPEPQKVGFRVRGVSIFTNPTDHQKVTKKLPKRLPNRSFWAFGGHFGRPWGLFWHPWGSLGALWVSLGSPLGSIWVYFGPTCRFRSGPEVGRGSPGGAQGRPGRSK